MLKMWIAASLAVVLVSGCATPEVVQTRQANDADMDCAQIKAAYAEAIDLETKARKERGMTGTNVAAAIFFWPAMIGTYKNTEEAVEAARERQRHLEKIADKKACPIG
ncbi:MAG: hypothetical protein MUE35_00340 [Hydrogenophaga sp.]|jgi:hypothetical protein|nr:hypothetical protein [Hydrogenophaga sp.]